MADLDFGEALRILQGGGCVARRGWNGKNMYLFLVEPDTYDVFSYPATVGDTNLGALGLDRNAYC